MTSTELEYAERRMQQKWYDLVTAEQQGASPQALERLYNAYMLTVEDYNRCSAALTAKPTRAGRSRNEQPTVSPTTSHTQKTSRAAGRRRKAS